MTAKRKLNIGDFVRVWLRNEGRFAAGTVINRTKDGITVRHMSGTAFIPTGRENPVTLLQRREG